METRPKNKRKAVEDEKSRPAKGSKPNATNATDLLPLPLVSPDKTNDTPDKKDTEDAHEDKQGIEFEVVGVAPSLAKPTPPYCYVHVLERGKNRVFRSEKLSNAYKDKNADSIKDTMTFLTKADFDAFNANMKKDQDNLSSNQSNTLTAEEHKALARINQKRQLRIPTKSLHIRYKTTSFSNAVIVLWELRDHEGKKLWHWKPRDIIPTLQAFQDDTHTSIASNKANELITNMAQIEKRNLEKGENAVLKTKKGYGEHYIYTYFILDLPDEGWTVQAKNQSIHNVLTHFGSELKRIMSSNLFLAAYRDCVGAYSKVLGRMIFEPEKGVGFRSFIQQTTINVGIINDYTDVSSKRIHSTSSFPSNILLSTVRH